MGTTTDINGHYSLKVDNNVNLLVFAYMGMGTQEVELNGRSQVDVEMNESSQQLDAVVVTGYGSARKVGSTVGSVQQVSAKKLESRPAANVLDALQGQVSGLQVFTSTGDPSATQSVRLHGVGSLGAGSEPLYILDGQPIPSSMVVSLNPNDYESLTVLKDASATSIYGSRAANGVIVLTSKRGRQGDARVVLKSQYGISQQANRKFYNNMMTGPELIDFYEERGLFSDDPEENKAGAAQFRIENPYDTKWLDVFQRDNVPTFQTDLSVQGGNDRTTYFVSGSQFSQQGTAIGSSYERYTLRANIESRAKSWLLLGTNVIAGRSNSKESFGYNANNTNGGLFYLKVPYISPFNEDGSRTDIIESPYDNPFPHPGYLNEKTNARTQTNTVNANFFVEIEPIAGLKIRSRAGANYRNPTRHQVTYPSYYYAYGKGNASKSSTQAVSASITNTIEYAWRIAKNHDLTILVGHEGIADDSWAFAGSGKGMTDDRLMELGQGTTYTSSSSQTHSRFLSFFGRLDYSFNDKLFFDFSIRNDASSRFGRDNRNAMFWALGGKWLLHKEKFMQNARSITNFSLKASYGTQGNAAIGDYSSLQLIGQTNNAYQQVNGIGIASPGNPNLSWETQGKLTVGAEIEFLNRWRLSAEYYLRHTSNMLLDIPNPATTGFSTITGNAGSLNNSGIDLNLGLDILQGKDYYLTVSVNFNYNKEKVTKLFDGMDRYDWDGYSYSWVVGQAVNYYMPIYAGVNPENGKQQWYLPGSNIDVTNKGEITEDNVNIQQFMQNTGIALNAPISGGFSLAAGWRGIAIQADFSCVLGKYLVNNDAFFYANPAIFYYDNQSKDVMDYWTPENPNAKYPNWLAGEAMDFDTHLLENASFLRLKNLSISYSFPQRWMKKTKVFENIKIFAMGRNLFTVTKYGGVDPEIDSNLTVGGYINSRQYSVGLELTF